MRVQDQTSNSTRAFRSRYVALLSRRRTRWLAALACTSSALAMLTACDMTPPAHQPQATVTPQAEQVTVYKTLAECKAAQSDARICDAAFDEAREWQGQQPGYASKAQCEEEFGANGCETRQDRGGNWFVPLMAGVMLSNAMNRMSYSQYQQQNASKYQRGGMAYPVYVNSRGFVSTYAKDGTRPLNHRVMTNGGLPPRLDVQGDPFGRGPAVANSAYQAPSGSKTYAAQTRGGFGSSTTYRGGCCG